MGTCEINLATVLEARGRIRNFVVKSPLKPSFELRRRTAAQVFLKLENMQATGSFKIRGAANAILKLSEKGGAAGVVAASSGNHGRAVAYVAQQLGMASTICMTNLVPEDKIRGIREFGADVVLHGDDQNQAVEMALRIAEERDFKLIPPFDDALIISGQGTIGLEILEQMPDIEALVVPVSGGGLMSGIATAARAIRPNMEIIGVTTRYDAAIYESIRAGRLTMVGERPSIADALPGPIPLDNRYTFRICRDLVDEIVPVADEAIAHAMRFAIDHEKVVLEGGGAIGIAHVLENSSKWRGRKVAVVCSGNNVSRERLESIFEQFEIA